MADPVQMPRKGTYKYKTYMQPIQKNYMVGKLNNWGPHVTPHVFVLGFSFPTSNQTSLALFLLSLLKHRSQSHHLFSIDLEP